jgi:hypothetical protein
MNPNCSAIYCEQHLGAAPDFGEPWGIAKLPFQWSQAGNRDWEETVKISIVKASAPSLPTSLIIRPEESHC